MIYIVSEYAETTTDEVVAYCKKVTNSVLRLNYEDMPLDNLTIDISDIESKVTISFQNENCSLSSKDVLWFRRGAVKFQYPFTIKKFSDSFVRFIKEEETYFDKAFYTIPFSISDYQADLVNNKLDNLMIAKNVGLNIPATILTSSKKNALSFIEKHHRCITKPLNNGHFNDKIIDNVIVKSKGTFEVFEEDFLVLDDTFVPMLLQQYIPKIFELRIFCFMEKIYSMAIFSQNDKQTELDYRNYN
jgi:hypothetical protein